MVPRHGGEVKVKKGRSLFLEILMPSSDSSKKALLGNWAVWDEEAVAQMLVVGSRDCGSLTRVGQ